MMEKQSKSFICIIYPGKHDGTLLLIYEARIEQLEQSENKFWTKQLQQTTAPRRVKNATVFNPLILW